MGRRVLTKSIFLLWRDIGFLLNLTDMTNEEKKK
ncbi:hypothetical protein T09_12319 [Trichinella sp. T9]|nr:hypothetical protein T09_12319 [Trichinella sp. T9]